MPIAMGWQAGFYWVSNDIVLVMGFGVCILRNKWDPSILSVTTQAEMCELSLKCLNSLLDELWQVPHCHFLFCLNFLNSTVHQSYTQKHVWHAFGDQSGPLGRVLLCGKLHCWNGGDHGSLSCPKERSECCVLYEETTSTSCLHAGPQSWSTWLCTPGGSVEISYA